MFVRIEIVNLNDGGHECASVMRGEGVKQEECWWEYEGCEEVKVAREKDMRSAGMAGVKGVGRDVAGGFGR